VKIPVKQLTAISLLSAVGATVRVGLGWVAFSVPAVSLPFGFSFYGIFIKIGLTETLTFVSGFAFGPVQGFVTGTLIILVSDMFSMYGLGLWTPFIAAIIGLIGVCGGVLRRSKKNLSIIFLGLTAVALTIMSELLQTTWFAWYMWAFYTPETPFLTVLAMSLAGGIASTATALFNNVVFFVAIAPKIIKLLQEWVIPKKQ